MMRKRILLVAAAVVALVGGGLGVAQLASAAPSGAAATNCVALVAPITTARGWYINANGIPQLLPMGPNAIPGHPGDYRNCWFRGVTLDGGSKTPVPAPSTTAVPTPTVTAVAERAPVLSVAGTPKAASVTLKWSEAVAASGEVVSTYVIQQQSGASAWTTSTPSPQPATSVVVDGLESGQAYVLRVRAEYVSGVDGPWSNVVAVQTPAT